MAGYGISAPAEGRLVISNQWLEANKHDKNAVIDIPTRKSNPTGAFLNPNVPRTSVEGQASGRGVSVRGIYDGSEGTSSYNPTHQNYKVDLTADYATINCCYNNEKKTEYFLEDFRTKITHPDRIKRIKAYGTNARGISIKL